MVAIGAVRMNGMSCCGRYVTVGPSSSCMEGDDYSKARVNGTWVFFHILYASKT